MDLQIVTDEIAAVMYLCNYLTKGEKAMGETLKHVAKECRNDDIHTQMKKIKKEFLGKRTLASPETAMRVLSMWFMKKSRKVTSVNTDMQEEHISVPKNYEQLSQLDDDDDNVFATSIIDQYGARPDNLKEMCLAKFAVNYDVISTTVDDDVGNDENCYEDDGDIKVTDEMSESNKIRLKNRLGYMRKRKQESIL